jgi:hypothetical protein
MAAHQGHCQLAFIIWIFIASFIALLHSPFQPVIAAQHNDHFQQDQLLPLHPLSPPESLRRKRQAYQVYLGGETSVSVDQGAGDSGPWSEWAKERECCEFTSNY